MPRPRSIYVLSMRFIFHFQSHFRHNQSYNFIKTDTLVFVLFKIIFYYFWMKTWMKRANNFQIAKLQPQGVY